MSNSSFTYWFQALSLNTIFLCNVRFACVYCTCLIIAVPVHIVLETSIMGSHISQRKCTIILVFHIFSCYSHKMVLLRWAPELFFQVPKKVLLALWLRLLNSSLIYKVLYRVFLPRSEIYFSTLKIIFMFLSGVL